VRGKFRRKCWKCHKTWQACRIYKLHFASRFCKILARIKAQFPVFYSLFLNFVFYRGFKCFTVRCLRSQFHSRWARQYAIMNFHKYALLDEHVRCKLPKYKIKHYIYKVKLVFQLIRLILNCFHAKKYLILTLIQELCSVCIFVLGNI
jgi:hypothetical protein